MSIITTQYGKNAEEYVATALEQRGYTILARNYRKPYGEIDIISTKGNVIAFIEVKARTKIDIDPATLITPTKQRKIGLVAKEFIARHEHTDKICRFDVALVEKKSDGYTLTYIPNAFYV